MCELLKLVQFSKANYIVHSNHHDHFVIIIIYWVSLLLCKSVNKKRKHFKCVCKFYWMVLVYGSGVLYTISTNESALRIITCFFNSFFFSKSLYICHTPKFWSFIPHSIRIFRICTSVELFTTYIIHSHMKTI